MLFRSFAISALTGEGLPELTESMALYAESRMLSFVAEIPYSSSELEAYVREFGVVEQIEYESEHIRLTGKLQKSRMGPLAAYLQD